MVASEKSDAPGAVKKCLSEFKEVPVSQFEDTFYTHFGDEAIRHIFRVASSLDSMVVGEPQILGQVKDAYKTAILEKTSGVILNKLLHRTFSVAKQVRSDTGIGDHAVSISYAAIKLGRKIFGTLEEKKVLLIGAGEMAELSVEHLINNGTGQIIVANRTFENGVKLAERYNGKAIRFEEITDHLRLVDIIISSTGSADFIIRHDQVKGIMRLRRNRPIFFIDIAVPRDIDPDINLLTNVYIYDIDDLKGIIEENIEDRLGAATKGERIVDEAVIRFRGWYENLDVVPTIKALRKKADAIAEAEVKKTLNSLSNLSDEDYQSIRRMAAAIINKILHDPMLSLKNSGTYGDKAVFLDSARKLFKLDD
jgi:glutamyl-tRNA reductase